MPSPFYYHKSLSDNWHIQSSQKTKASGKVISQTNFNIENWHPTSVPSTVLGALVQNGIYKDLYVSNNLTKVDTQQFKFSWWYRTKFELTEIECKHHVILHLKGINYRANIWLNGEQIVTSNEVYGAFRQFQFDISTFVKYPFNTLAIEVFPPQPGEFSIGFVDWNEYPPDQNMGLFRGVHLEFNKGVSIKSPMIATSLTTEGAVLEPMAILQNHSNNIVTGLLKGSIEDIHFEQSISINTLESKQVVFSPTAFPQLMIKDPKLWWPNNLGAPHLYEMSLVFEMEGKISDEKSILFGIRTVEAYLNEDGHKGFKINGQKILIKGAGWVDDLLLQNTDDNLEAQIAYVKHMNLNCIRLEGFWGTSQKLYDLCDQHGILMMVGWSCHWEHEEYLGKPTHEQYGGAVTPEDIELLAQSWQDQLLWLRHHPSIFVWTVASDFLPQPDLERRYIKVFQQYDYTRPYLNSTGGVGSERAIITDSEIVSEISGSSGVKMLGPYAYTPPIYWYENKTLGGAYGFNTETCQGANIPPLESIKKFIPEAHLWPINEVWEIHCGKNNFRTLDRIEKAITARYGKPKGVADFAAKAQLLNYELMRAMFEAFQANHGKATGIIQWMLNSAWPNFYWQLYDCYLLPNAAFYATRKACAPIHFLYDYSSYAIQIINSTFVKYHGISIKIEVFDIDSRSVYHLTEVINLNSTEIKALTTLPSFENISATYFLDLRVLGSDEQLLSNNFYWLSTQRDELDYEAKFEDWAFYTPTKVYADFTLLSKLPKVEVKLNYRFESGKVIVDLENDTDKIAFFLYLQLKDKTTGASVLPIFWEDNYVSLLPFEKRRIIGWFGEELNFENLVLVVE